MFPSLSITVCKLLTTYNYDLLSRRKQTIDANGNITTYSYDKVNNLKEITKADGNTIKYDYDKLFDAISLIIWPLSLYWYSKEDIVCSPLSFVISKESEQDEDINTMYTYDVTGKLISMEDCLGNTANLSSKS